MRFWIVVGCGVLILGAAILPVRSPEPPPSSKTFPPAVMNAPPAVAPKSAPPRVVEVIDLSRTYEPVREPEEPVGAIDPASLIQIPEGPKQIPAAVDLADPFRDVLDEVRGAPIGSHWFSVPLPESERIDVMPREVSALYGRSWNGTSVGFSVPTLTLETTNNAEAIWWDHNLGRLPLVERISVSPREVHSANKRDVLPREVK